MASVPSRPIMGLFAPEPPQTPPPIDQPNAIHPNSVVASIMSTNHVQPPTPAPSPHPDRIATISSPWDQFVQGANVAPSLAALSQDADLRALETEDFLPGSDEVRGSASRAFVSYVTSHYSALVPPARRALISLLMTQMDAPDLLHASSLISPLLKRDFLAELPYEIDLQILAYLDDPKDLVRASQVSRTWRSIVNDDRTWKVMCERHRLSGLGPPLSSLRQARGYRDMAEAASSSRLPGTVEVDLQADAALDTVDATEFEAEWALAGLGLVRREGDAPSHLGLGIRDPSASASEASSLDASPVPGTSASTVRPTLPLPIPSPILRPSPARSHNAFGTGTSHPRSSPSPPAEFSYKTQFKRAYLTESNWVRGTGRLVSTQASSDDAVVTSLGFDSDWIVLGMATSQVHVFDSDTGAYVRTLTGHSAGVWCLTLVSRGGVASPLGDLCDMADALPTPSPRLHRRTGSVAPVRSEPSTPSKRRPLSFSTFEELAPGGGITAQQASICGTSRGWGRSGALVVSGGCDRDVRVWDVSTGSCLRVLQGHSSTVRCLKVLDRRPVAVSGSRDSTLRVWDIERGQLLHVLSGHSESVRCLEVSGNKVVSGSYDTTCRLWDADTGECKFVFRGHFHQIYAIAFDGQRVATGSLDSTVRIWSARTGDCLALLQGHTSLVGQLQLTDSVLVTGGSDGRVIVFSLATLECLHRLCAHDNSVTCLQFDSKYVVTGSNDGRVKLWDYRSGKKIRELTEPCDAVWRAVFRDDKCVIVCKRGGRTVLDLYDFRSHEV